MFEKELFFTEETITELKENEVFVFGSNELGLHGSGAAYHALKNFGAVYNIGFGHKGRTFAIPTKDWGVNKLPIEVIQFYVDRFIAYAKTKPNLKFLVTKIGCGLAGYTVQNIAPLFEKSLGIDNIILPKEFYDELTK